MKSCSAATQMNGGTPQGFFDKLNEEFNFSLDPCATDENTKCDEYYTIEEDGLNQSWKGQRVFCNPPYGKEISKWVEKSYKESLEGTVVVMLIPSRTDTKYWHEWIFGKAEIRFIKGRLKFTGKTTKKESYFDYSSPDKENQPTVKERIVIKDSVNSAPFPSAIVIFGAGKKL